MQYKLSTSLILVAAFVLLAASVMAGGTKLISYQGRVTTTGGSNVADGTYPATFAFFATAAGGSQLWSESSAVSTIGGLFTHILGSVTPIADTLFPANGEVWLEVTFNGQQQIPRTQFLAASYALRVNTIDGAQGGVVTDSIVLTPGPGTFINSPGGGATMDSKALLGFTGTSPLMAFYEPLDSKIVGKAVGSIDRLEIGSRGLHLLEVDGTVHSFLEPNRNGSGGYFFIGQPKVYPYRFFEVDGNLAGTGNSQLTISSDLGYIRLNPSAVGTAAVTFPPDAIDAYEIKDEPGIAQAHYYSTIGLSGLAMRTLDSVIISTPSDGYIVIDGFCSVRRSGTTGMNYTYFQIDTASGGSANWPDYAVVGSYQQVASTDQYGSVTATKTYYLAAGTYKFFFEGMGDPSNSTGWSASANYPTVRATFFPTSYGTVQSVVSQSEASGYADKVAVAPQAIGSNPASSQTAYSVDLRDLEIKAARARAAAEKAERELREAEMNRQLQGNDR